MRYVTTIIFIAILTASSMAQNIRFDDPDKVIIVNEGAKVSVQCDSTRVIGKSRATRINQELEHLDSLKIKYNQLIDENSRFASGLYESERLLREMLKDMKTDSMEINENLSHSLEQLHCVLQELQRNNLQLKSQNSQLDSTIVTLEESIKGLKKQTRHTWWNSLGDKIIAFTGGVGIGILLAVLL